MSSKSVRMTLPIKPSPAPTKQVLINSIGIVMALGADKNVLGDKGAQFSFVVPDPFIKGRSRNEIESGLISGLESQKAV